jgi:hypothetical protein
MGPRQALLVRWRDSGWVWLSVGTWLVCEEIEKLTHLGNISFELLGPPSFTFASVNRPNQVAKVHAQSFGYPD